MKSSDKVVAELRALDPRDPKTLEQFRKALRGKSGYVAAAIAKIVAEHRLALIDELAAAFGTFDVKSDPSCRGRVAIATALHDLDEWDDRVFVAGLSITQLEGGVDTAGGLRGICGLAHVHAMRPNALDVLAGLLADPERNARLAAAQGFGDSGRPDACAVLRYMLLRRDEQEPEVIATCFDALFALARDASAQFALAMLAQTDMHAEAAAIALGGARVTDACKPLVAWCARCRPEQRHRVGYVALALLRDDAANAVLLDAIRDGSKSDALAAAKALATFKDDAAVAASLREVAMGSPIRREIESMLDR